jgi:hypothetical protein
MTILRVNRWNGQFARPRTLAVIRRKIVAMQAHGTVMVDFEGSTATAEQIAILITGFPDHKVRFSGNPAALPHPLPEGVVIPAAKPRPSRSKPPTYRPQSGDGETPKRGDFVRVSAFWLPSTLSEDLPALALLSTPSGTLEGWLLEPLVVGGRISLDVRYWHSQLTLGWFGSPTIIRINGEWALSEKYLYRVFRVPPLGHCTLGEIP